MITYLSIPRAKNWNGEPFAVIQRKYDGLRCLVRRTITGYDARTRDGKTDLIRMLDRRVGWLRHLPIGSALDCEIYVEGVHATSVITHLKDNERLLHVAPFAIPWWNNEDTRRKSFAWAEKTAISNGIPFAQSIENSPAWDCREKLQMRAMDLGWEGFILKQAHYDGWFKVKPIETMDLVVRGCTISRSKSFNGGLKAIQVYDGDTLMASVGTGFDADWRMSVDPRTLIGRVAEIAYDSLAANGKLKFPRFIRWRDDK